MVEDVFLKNVEMIIQKYQRNDRTDDVEITMKEIFSPFEDPSRYYHNLTHLEELAETINASGNSMALPWGDLENEVLLWSILFHDRVYFPGNSDNEKKSADFWNEFSKVLLIPDTIRFLVEVIILSTKDHEIPRNLYEDDFVKEEPIIPRYDLLLRTFLDADRSILGSSQGKYMDYTKQIRLEYVAFPDEIFKIGRKIFLETMLQRAEIYYTPFFRDAFEVQARKNMETEILSI